MLLDDIRVLDLSWGVAGPMVGMLLADHGARVTRVERPAGDPFVSLSGTPVWRRGKDRVVLDLTMPADREAFLALVDHADVVIESFRPGVTSRLGIDYATLHARNPRLVHCSITGYGPDDDRPGYDALVAAATGQLYEGRGVIGTTVALLSGTDGILPGVEAPEGCMVGAPRAGPLFSGVPWPSLGAFYLGLLGVSAALRARELTGRGQHVQASLLQGVLATTVGSWQRVERPDSPGFLTWIPDPRAPRGFFKAADGEWTHHWVPLPSFILGAVSGEQVTGPRNAPSRITTFPEEMLVLHGLHEALGEAVASLDSNAWVELAASVGVPVQRVRSPEEALLDPALLADGCVIERDGIRQVGRVYSVTPTPGGSPAASRNLATPLDGIRVLDLGLAVAGPFGTQLLSDMGAEVIKVTNGLFDEFWMRNHIAMCCNRGKRSITIDLKQAEGLAILHELVRSADVVHHNMRADAAVRLGVSYDALRKVNPALIYCHTRGHDRSRELLPGNDQTAAALAGVSWMEGGVESGAMPIWPATSLGDTGNGFLSAIAVIQALRHRDRTGEGGFVDTSILYAHLLNASMTWVAADGSTKADRPMLDAMQTGWGPDYRLWETADGWICVAGPAEVDPSKTSAEWKHTLDAGGVPCEVVDPTFPYRLFDDPTFRQRGWVTFYQHPLVGRIDAAGVLVDLSDTPGRVAGPPLVPGQDTRTIMAELGYDEAATDRLLAGGVIAGPPKSFSPPAAP